MFIYSFSSCILVWISFFSATAEQDFVDGTLEGGVTRWEDIIEEYWAFEK